MSTTYGLGLSAGTLAIDASRETAIALLRSVAAFVSVPVRDLLNDGAVVEVSPDGTVASLADADGAAIRAAVEAKRGGGSYAAFRFLDGYHVLVPGAVADGTPDDAPDDCKVYVSPLEDLCGQLDALLARDDIERRCQTVHRDLRARCDEAARLRVPLVLGS